jgi:mannose/fructose/N-acetylgalactosamine-specific phosphotransferase system component IIC
MATATFTTKDVAVTKGSTIMGLGAMQWTLITVIGVALLAIVIAVAAARNRVSAETRRKTEEGTRDLYRKEEEARHGEGDNAY